MKKFLLLLTIYTAFSIAAFAQWTTLASDGTGDGSKGGSSYLDGTKLEYMYDDQADSIWFRVTVANVLNSNYGINIIMNVNGAGSTANWFGSNTTFKYNRIITAWITSGTSGTVGITDAAGFAAMNYTKLGSNNIDISIDAANKTYTLGLKRTDIYNDTVLKADIIAGVGSNQYWDDDVPNSGSGSVAVQPATVSVSALSLADAGYTLYPNPAQDKLHIKRNNLSKNTTVSIYNTTGQLIHTSVFDDAASLHTIDISDQAKGVYFVRINSDNQQMTATLICK